jgi:hypothetical protein
MRKLIWILPVIILVVIVAAFLTGRFFYYTTSVGAYTPPQRGLATPEYEAVAKSARLEAVDQPKVSQGVVVIDYAHDNALYIEELNVLLSKITARGFSYELALETPAEGLSSDNSSLEPDTSDPSITPTPTSTPPQDGLTDKLRYASSLILPLPNRPYTPAEVDAIKHFVEKGGRVLLIGDPTRTVVVESLNSIASAFGIIYANDYLYSLNHNDNNYRNVVYTQFKKSPLTTGLENGKVIFYAGGSMQSPGNEIILGDDTTHSSISEGGRVNAAAALAVNNRVLALGDLTFMVEPYSNAENNGALINNIATFLSGGQRDLTLADFPHFFNSQVDLVFNNSLVFNSQFAGAVKLKHALEQAGRVVTFTNKIGQNDAIFIGRFDEAKVVQDYLDTAGITILGPDDETAAGNTPTTTATPTEPGLDETDLSVQKKANGEDHFVEGRIQIKNVGDLERGGTTLFYLLREPQRNVLIILSDDATSNTDAFELLLKNNLQQCLVSQVIAACQTQQPGKEITPGHRKTEINKILIVSDDNGLPRADAQTGAADFERVLSATYKINVWTTSLDGSPNLEKLLEYDAIIWTSGDYWDKSIDKEDTLLLTQYVESGGNLLASGAFIASDWQNSDFLSKVLHASYQNSAPQVDLQAVLSLPSLKEGEVIKFLPSPSGQTLNIDVVNNTSDAQIAFARGPLSEQAGAAAGIIYEDERTKTIYCAFPIYLLPVEAQNRLIGDMVEWFTMPSTPTTTTSTPSSAGG